MKTEFGKYLLDVSKLVLGGAVLITILNIQGMEKLVTLLVGFSVSVTCKAKSVSAKGLC